jgi:precorrin-4 methylase
MCKTLGIVLMLVLACGCSKTVKTATENPGKRGTYHIVGIGPGDADLITERGRAAIQSADIVFASPKIQEKLSSVIDFKGKEVVDGYGVLFRFYGKDCKTMTDEQKNNPKNRMSCEEYHARQAGYVKRVRDAVNGGKNVVLLSSGDPTIYGPDIWNLRELAELSPILVPGLSSFNAATAALKVSLGEVILTAPFKGKDGEAGKDSLENLVKKDKATVVIFMPRDLKDLMARLRSSCDAGTPMAVVSCAGIAGKEKTILGTVGDMEKKLEGEDMNMCLVYVGKALEAAHVKDRPAGKAGKQGTFYLVGAGPGDADLATLRALSVLKKADIVFSSRKISDRFKKELEGKQIIDGYGRLFPFYGKSCSEVTGTERKSEKMGCEEYHEKQAELAAMVRKAVAEGKNVAMLDSGDPLIYGPCSWTLSEFKDIKTEVVPGLSCFNAANAALKQGVTEGKASHSVVLASGWTVNEMAELQGTMVLFTMRTEFRSFIDALGKHYAPETPVAIVESAGFSEKEKVIRSTLGAVLTDPETGRLPFEYLLYVGDFLKGDGKM